MKITLDDLRNIVKEELQLEVVDHVGISTVVTQASKLLKSIEAFEKSGASPAVVAAIGSQLQSVKASLEDMVQNPSSYVTKQSKHIVVKKPKSGTTL